MSSFSIEQFDFNNYGKELLGSNKRGKNWPVVYLIHNDNTMYVGETSSAYYRFEQHLNNVVRKDLKKVEIIFDDEFNKSAILDIEQTLIQIIGADGKYHLQNLNGGQSSKHNYYQREKYVNKISLIWNELLKRNLARNSYQEIINSNIFKYSPYNTLTEEQNNIASEIIYDALTRLENNQKGVSVIQGKAGTGKTILLINIIFKIIAAARINYDFTAEDDDLTDNMALYHAIKEFTLKNYMPKIGFVVPMTSLRKTMEKVFKGIGNGLSPKMVIGPLDVVKEHYDILFVDEAHRLADYKFVTYHDQYKKAAAKVGLDENSTSLDFIMKSSKYQVLVFDEKQTVKKSDITINQFNRAVNTSPFRRDFVLHTQMRCKGGSTYIDYVDDILNCQASSRLDVIDYDLRLYDDVNDMVTTIKSLDKTYGLCRNAAGYSWEWVSKKCKTYEEAVSKGLYDIVIGDYKYIWNMNDKEFILSDNAINEIGCIHTLQGYDLNYVGLIFGREIDYDPINNKMIINPKYIYDKGIKLELNDINNLNTKIKSYIINSYKVIMTRGIKGCYAYACNENLRKYLSKFMDEVKKNG